MANKIVVTPDKIVVTPVGWNPKTKAQRIYTNKSDNEVTLVTDPKLSNVHYNPEHINKLIEKLGNYKNLYKYKIDFMGFNVLDNEKDSNGDYKHFSIGFKVDGLFTHGSIVDAPINEIIYSAVKKVNNPPPNTVEEFVEFIYRQPMKSTKVVYKTTANETTLNNFFTFVDGLVKFKHGE